MNRKSALKLQLHSAIGITSPTASSSIYQHNLNGSLQALPRLDPQSQSKSQHIDSSQTQPSMQFQPIFSKRQVYSNVSSDKNGFISFYATKENLQQQQHLQQGLEDMSPSKTFSTFSHVRPSKHHQANSVSISNRVDSTANKTNTTSLDRIGFFRYSTKQLASHKPNTSIIMHSPNNLIDLSPSIINLNQASSSNSVNVGRLSSPSQQMKQIQPLSSETFSEASSSPVKKGTQMSSITNLQIESDQNRLDFMIEKGQSFEKHMQLVKLKQENHKMKLDLRKSTAEISRLQTQQDNLSSQLSDLQLKYTQQQEKQVTGKFSNTLHLEFFAKQMESKEIAIDQLKQVQQTNLNKAQLRIEELTAELGRITAVPPSDFKKEAAKQVEENQINETAIASRSQLFKLQMEVIGKRQEFVQLVSPVATRKKFQLITPSTGGSDTPFIPPISGLISDFENLCNAVPKRRSSQLNFSRPAEPHSRKGSVILIAPPWQSPSSSTQWKGSIWRESQSPTKCSQFAGKKEVLNSGSNTPSQRQTSQQQQQLQNADEEEILRLKQMVKSLCEENEQLRVTVNENDNLMKQNKLQQAFIQSQADQMVVAQRELVELNKALNSLRLQLSYVKDGEDIKKTEFLHQFSLVKTEWVEQIQAELTTRVEELTNIQAAYEMETELTKQLQSSVRESEERFQWTKKRASEISKKGGTFNFSGLVSEVYEYKLVIDRHMKAIPTITEHPSSSEIQTGDSPAKLIEDVVSETQQLNQRMVDMVDRLKQEEEKTRSIMTAFPVLRQLESANVKIINQLRCAKCDETLTKAITCVPCGHHFCKSCHYSWQTKDKENTAANVACWKCGPQTLVYRNQVLDEVIEMAGVLNTAKELVKTFVSSNS